MTGYVIDPSNLDPKRGAVTPYSPKPGDTYYRLTRNGVAQGPAGFEVFPTWAAANAMAQDFNGGLDAIDRGSWGVVSATA